MDALAYLTPATKLRRALLNDTIAALPGLYGGRGVTFRPSSPGAVFDPAAAAALQAAGPDAAAPGAARLQEMRQFSPRTARATGRR
jgi:hypothetical protein